MKRITAPLIKKSKLCGVTLLVLSLIPSTVFGATNGNVGHAQTIGKTLTAQQEAVKSGQEKLNAQIKSGKFDNLGQIISSEVQLHEQNGFKFGGLSFSVTNGSTVTKYNLTKDVLHQEVYQEDSNHNLKKLSEKTFNSFDSTNTTKFSHVTPGLLNILSNIKLKKESPKVDTSVAHAYQATSYDGYQSSNYLDMLSAARFVVGCVANRIDGATAIQSPSLRLATSILSH